MRAIIIDDKDSIALIDQLKLELYASKDRIHQVAEKYVVSPTWVEEVTRDVHRWFHYVVTNWLHEQGAKTR